MKKQILIVDDSESVREAIAISLETAGMSVNRAADGQEGLNFLNGKSDVDLVITDLNMPNMDGITLVEEIRKHPVYKFTPVLILTTESQHIKRQEAKKAGATGWLVKPFAKDQLIQVVQKVLR